MKADVVVIAFSLMFAAGFAGPAWAETPKVQTFEVQVQVVGAHGKSIGAIPLHACETKPSETECVAIIAESVTNAKGSATFVIPYRTWPNQFRIEPVDPSRQDITVLYRTFVHCGWVLNKTYSPLISTCDHTRSASSAFQPLRTSDTYPLGASEIVIMLGKKP
jgi:hypothetical protein